MTTAAVIATRYFPPQLARLCEVLQEDGVTPVVVPDIFARGRDWTLYRLWNAGLQIARDVLRADVIAVMNDDVALELGSLPAMRAAIEAIPNLGIVYPDDSRPLSAGLEPTRLEATTGSWGVGGMTGFCFMFHAERVPIAFDEGYAWWYGDDDFEERVRGLGLRVARYLGIPVEHVPGRSAARSTDGLQGYVMADRALWDSRHHNPVLGACDAPVGQTDAVAAGPP